MKMSECKTCDDEKVLRYYGECCICADCSDDLKMFDYITELKQTIKNQAEIIEKLKECVMFYGSQHEWWHGEDRCVYNEIDDSDLYNFNDGKVGGKLARKTLKQIEEMETNSTQNG